MLVYVLHKDGTPLMPCSPYVARMLLRDGKATVKRRTPFTIKLLEDTGKYVEKLTIGIDPGSSVVGSAVVNSKGSVFFLGERVVRNDITKTMKQRASYRRNRRNRKTRYRQPRFLNRASSRKEDRLPPTVVSKLNSHKTLIKFIMSILPVHRVVVEQAKFDVHRISNPNVSKKYGWAYQHGQMYGWENTKSYVRDRDGYQCKKCKAKNTRLEVHHILEKINGGTDTPDNLITLCSDCHGKIHMGTMGLGKKKLASKTRHATQTDTIVAYLLKWVKTLDVWVSTTFGSLTKVTRELYKIKKRHCKDALAIGLVDSVLKGKKIKKKYLTKTMLSEKCISKGDYQQTKGVRSEKSIPTGKMFGFRKFDKVLYEGTVCYIKGRMSSGYAILMDIEGTKLKFNHIPKFSKMKRLQARRSTLSW